MFLFILLFDFFAQSNLQVWVKIENNKQEKTNNFYPVKELDLNLQAHYWGTPP